MKGFYEEGVFAIVAVLAGRARRVSRGVLVDRSATSGANTDADADADANADADADADADAGAAIKDHCPVGDNDRFHVDRSADV